MTLLELGLEVKRLRDEQKLSQRELARRAGVSRVTLARLETGVLAELGHNKLERLVNALGYELAVRPARHRRTLDDLAQERGAR